MSDRDWTEDFSQENGFYLNVCSQCKQEFKGYKCRHICKTCSQEVSEVRTEHEKSQDL